MKTRLTERDLNRIVRRVINEGTPIDVAQNLDSNWVGANNGMTGTWKIENGYLYLFIGNKNVASMKAA